MFVYIRKRTLIWHQICWCLDLTFPSLQNWEISLLLISHTTYGILLQQPTWNKTTCKRGFEVSRIWHIYCRAMGSGRSWVVLGVGNWNRRAGGLYPCVDQESFPLGCSSSFGLVTVLGRDSTLNLQQVTLVGTEEMRALIRPSIYYWLVTQHTLVTFRTSFFSLMFIHF